jgi:hypothetical protein
MPIQIRVIVITAGLIIAGVLGTAVLLTSTTNQTLKDQVQFDAKTYLSQYAQVLGKNWNTAEGQQMLAHMDTEVLGEHLYTAWVVDSKGQIVGHATLPNHNVPEQISPADAAHIQAVLSQKTALSDTEDTYFWIAAPIKPLRSAEVYGAILGYVPTQRLRDTINQQIAQSAGVAGLVLVLGLAIYALLIRSLTPLVRRLYGAILAIENDSFQTEMLAGIDQRTDVLGHLARALQRAGAAVQERTERLEQQMQELRIEINEARKDKEVAEIVDSDYFHELQRKAQDLRAHQAPRRESHPTADGS